MKTDEAKISTSINKTKARGRTLLAKYFFKNFIEELILN
jgi:hypothetical protein